MAMWKRLNHPRSVRQSSYEEPVLSYKGSVLEKSYVEAGDHLGLIAGQGRGLLELDEQQHYGYGSEYTNRPQREDMSLKGLPQLSLEASPTQAHHQDQNQDSRLRPASSIYSQPSPNPVSTQFPQHSYRTPESVEEEVSPASSSDSLPVRNRYAFNEKKVSPINEMPDLSHFGLNHSTSNNKPASSISIMRREKRAQVAAAAANLTGRKQVGDSPRGRVAHDPRWDPYSGEITTSDKGKPQSVKPGTFSPPGLRPLHLGTGLHLGNKSSITGGTTQKTHTSFGEHVRRLKSSNSNGKERPAWKGATGRTALVSPVQDQHHMPPISVPRKSSPPYSAREGNLGSIVRTSSDETSPQPRATSPVNDPSDPVIVPQSVATKTLARNADDDGPGSRGMKREDGTMAHIEHAFEHGFREPLPDVSEEEEHEGKDGDGGVSQQPSSHISVTTHMPSEAATPRLSGHAFESHPAMLDLTPIVNRTRPRYVESPDQNPILKQNRDPDSYSQRPSSIRSVARKAVPMPPRTSSLSNYTTGTGPGKSLPPSPFLNTSLNNDPITKLQATLSALEHRRTNIVRSIRQMTELMPKDSIMDTSEVRRKREVEKKKIEALRVEEADVRREEHEVGLKLHRARRRKEREEGEGGTMTGLWVRRVTR
ncbi:hypothetical protein PZA11_001106 [Diplocarpon coronariae]|nr:hypothetical protein JHW43_001310 [Diplocarpon mali]